MTVARPLGVGLIGFGAIGSTIAAALTQRKVDRVHLTGVFGGKRTPPELATSLDDLVGRSDVVVEAASQSALASYGPAIKQSGCDLLALSIGALADMALHETLAAPAGGRVLLSSGACGGIDILRAAGALAPLESVSLKSSKPPASVVRAWMDDELKMSLTNAHAPICVFRGTARDAVQLFPESANIAGLIALATIGFDGVEVEIWGDPLLTRAHHQIAARGAAGEYAISIQNNLAPDNPRTSAVTAYAVLRALADRTSWTVIGC